MNENQDRLRGNELSSSNLHSNSVIEGFDPPAQSSEDGAGNFEESFITHDELGISDNRAANRASNEIPDIHGLGLFS